MIKDLRNSINRLTESEAKTILLHTLMRIEMIQESNESQKQMIADLFSWCNEILRLNRRNVKREYKTVHIVCGESPAGSLRVGLERGQLTLSSSIKTTLSKRL
ncbi:hypothetical protein BACCIP111895_02802 [Neobacillus rhizosphaerae]|uniref:Uncharacterized protein n=1 Tax=Neobacillus rhizosphaerae TaxID=2880965 RepID=A0ABM9ESL8_9BACI|nr:hypothetical protein BACCIP111895_02802 [Neobacillus rhizosphaerae]